ncbi:MAG: RDD family protein [Desulfobacterales bacterium]|nr:RDD family protein [Desulfobacterales bacterium]
MDSHYGGFWRRFVAFSSDKLILATIGFMMFILGSVAFGLGISPSDLAEEPEGLFALGMQVMAIYQAITIFLDMAYFTYFHGTTGQTPGQAADGPARRRGRGRADHPRDGLPALGRLHRLALCPCCMGFLWAGADRRKQGLARQDRRHRRDRPLPGRRGRDSRQKMP